MIVRRIGKIVVALASALVFIATGVAWVMTTCNAASTAQVETHR